MMLAFTTNNRILRIMVCVLAISLLAAGCAAQTTASVSTAITTAESKPTATTIRHETEPTATTTAAPTTFETEPVATKPPIVEPAEYITITTPAKNADGLVFQPLDISKGYKVDLNKDGVPEKISFVTSTEEFSDCYYIIINDQYTAIGSEENYDASWPVIADLDIKDDVYDLIYFQPWEEYWSTLVYYFDGEKLNYRGDIFGDIMLYDVENDLKPVALRDGFLDGQGNIITFDFSTLSFNINYDKNMRIAPNGLIEVISVQGFRRIYNYDWVANQKSYNFEMTLKMDLPLYTSPSAAKTSLTAQAGDSIQFIQCDDTWYQLRTQTGQLGWFRMEIGGNYEVIVGHQTYSPTEVFEGISTYDS